MNIIPIPKEELIKHLPQSDKDTLIQLYTWKAFELALHEFDEQKFKLQLAEIKQIILRLKR